MASLPVKVQFITFKVLSGSLFAIAPPQSADPLIRVKLDMVTTIDEDLGILNILSAADTAPEKTIPNIKLTLKLSVVFSFYTCPTLTDVNISSLD